MQLLHKMKRSIILLFSALLMLTSFNPLSISAKDDESSTIKVGFFEFEGYHNIDKYGTKSGYGYDFIQMISRYDNDIYEFVGYDCGWNEMMDMLDNGDIDILTNVAKTPEREEKYLFSSKTIGNDGSIFTVRDDNSTIISGSYETYDGVVVGSIQGSVQIDEFEAFAKEKGFTYEMKLYANEEDMRKALSNNEIDGVISIGLRNLQNEKVIEQINQSDMYVIVRKDDTELMAQINRAIDRLDQESTNWRSELFDKYYHVDQGNNISFLQDEIEYIQQLNESNYILKVAVNPDRQPYSYYVDGELTGIIPRIFSEVAERIGLQYEYVTAESRDDYRRLVESGDIDVCLDYIYSVSDADDNEYKLTSPYLSAAIARIVGNNYNGTTSTLAILEDADLSKAQIDALSVNVEKVICKTTEECIEAVMSGKADATYVYSYAAQIAVNEDLSNYLRMNIMMDYGNQFAIGVPKSKDYHLISILNKGINSIEDEFIQNIIMDETDYVVSEVPLSTYLSQNPVIIVSIVIIVILFLIAVILLIARIRSVSKMKLAEEKKNSLLEEKNEQEAEFVQAMTYVCRTNEIVRNTNLIDRTCTDYYLDGDTLKTRTSHYVGFDIANHNQIFHPDDYPLVVSRFDEEKVKYLSTHGGGEEYFECRSKGPDGEYRWYGYTMQAIPKDIVHPCNYIVYKKDINEAKLLEIQTRQKLEDALHAAEEASAAKGSFMSRMSHEIRTPLNAVIGYMTIAQMKDSDNEKIHHCLENSELAAKHLLSIINDVLDMSSIESGRIKIANTDYNLKQQISTISTIFYNQSKAKDIDFQVHISNLTEEWVVGDQLRVNQILMNLLSNAMKFTHENGNVTLDVEQLERTESQVTMRFRISDTGIGMSEEFLSRMYTPFEQESATTSQKYGGTGLGLSISKNLCTLMNGNLEVKSKLNEGSVFTVTLTFGISAENGKAKKSKDFSKIRVLVVDDQKADQTYTKELLRRIGTKTDIVSDGSTAVKRFIGRQNTDYAYDLCIIDWQMPDDNGINVARRIREAGDSDVPIIIATAYDVSEISNDAKAAGVNKVIAKPLFQSTLFDLLVDTFGKYNPNESASTVSTLNLAGSRILLAEDNDMNTEIAVSILTKAGLTVDTAKDGKEAYDIFTTSTPGKYAAILMDIQMPIMNGYEATRAIRESSHPEATTIPIIAMTANAFTSDVEEAFANGMNGHISKPVDFEKLYHTLSDCLKH